MTNNPSELNVPSSVAVAKRFTVQPAVLAVTTAVLPAAPRHLAVPAGCADNAKMVPTISSAECSNVALQLLLRIARNSVTPPAGGRGKTPVPLRPATPVRSCVNAVAAVAHAQPSGTLAQPHVAVLGTSPAVSSVARSKASVEPVKAAELPVLSDFNLTLNIASELVRTRRRAKCTGGSAEMPIIDKLKVVCVVVNVSSGDVVSPARVYRHLAERIGYTLDGQRHSRSSYVQFNVHNDRNGVDANVHAGTYRLTIEVNPTLWMQGFAAFCFQDPIVVICDALMVLLAKLKIPGCAIVPTHFTRLDLTHMYDAQSVSSARAFIERGKCFAAMRNAEKSTYDNGFYFKQGSEYKEFKMYHDEKKNAYGLVNKKYMGRMVRGEAVLKRQFLINQFGNPGQEFMRNFLHSDLQAIYLAQVRKLSISGFQSILHDRSLELVDAPHLLATYLRWRSRTLGLRNATFYRHRNEIFSRIDVDISLPPVELEPPENVMNENVLSELVESHCVTNLDHYCAMRRVPPPPPPPHRPTGALNVQGRRTTGTWAQFVKCIRD